MARELISKEIDGELYSFSQFGAKESVRVLLKIGKIVGEPMALFFGSMSGSGNLLDRKMDGSLLGQAAKALFQKAEEKEVLELLELLTAKSCQCSGKMIDFNLHYEGRLPHMFRVLQAAIEVQYGNFFDALSGFGLTSTPPQIHSDEKPPIFKKTDQP